MYDPLLNNIEIICIRWRYINNNDDDINNNDDDIKMVNDISHGMFM